MIHYGDVTKIKGSEVPLVDIITFGAPCQDLSVAGKRAGMKNVLMGDDETTRSGLFFEAIRIIKEMRDESFRQLSMQRTTVDIRCIQPRYAVYENVPGAFSSNKGEDFKAVLEETAKVADKDAVIPGPPSGKWGGAGCIVGDGWSVAWRVHDAQYWGVPQRRKRICLLADFNGDSAGKVLFELRREAELGDSEQTIADIGASSRSEVQSVAEGLSGDTAESREARQTIAGNAQGGIGETSRAISFQERAGKPGGGKGILIQNERTGALSTLNNQSVVYGISAYESNAMKSGNPHSGIYEAETSRTLDLNGGSPACNQGGMAVVCLENHPADSRVKISEDGMVQTLSSRMGTGGGNVPMVMESINGDIAGTLDASYYKGCGERQGVEREVVCMTTEMTPKVDDKGVGFSLRSRDYKDPQAVCIGNGQLAQLREQDVVGTLNCMHDQQAVMTYQDCTGTVDACIGKGTSNQLANNDMFVANTSVVRRLTPLECERLQGFPDYWTDIGEWVDSKGKKHKDADSPRYKALGNSIALPFWSWMAKRMCGYLDNPTMASLFDGIGGFPLSFSRAGCQPVWASEIEEFPIAVTKKRFPNVE